MRPADSPGTGPRTAIRKVTVTIPEDLLEEIRPKAAEHGLSAYFTEALRLKRERDRLRELADWLEEEHGPVTESERAAALRELEDLDAEHDHRRTATRNRLGETA
ncbi:CopG family transcriptional regulator [Streptomyces radiopugnans]|nr:CopG family transcriptional regulator [Streptomyces radiopugnans]